MSGERDIAGNDPNEISISTVVKKIGSGFRYFKSKWPAILVITLIFSLMGLAYSFYKKKTYTATCTFVLDEETKGGGMLSQYAGLASMAGINFNNTSGMFQGDNIIELYKSRSMIEKALLQRVTLEGKDQLLIDRYVAYNQLKDKWRKKDNIYDINFAGDPEKFSRKQDSLISDIVDHFNKKLLNVYKPDKKLNIIYVDFASHDELFAKEFTDQLVSTVNNFYIKTITQKAAQNVQILQRQADSVRSILNSSISGVAYASDAAPNANPLLSSLRVPSQRKQVDVQAGSAVYSAIVQNLELAKISLRQATPLIQVIDKPVLPLPDNEVGKGAALALGGLIGFIVSVLFLFMQKVYRILAQ